LVEIILDAESSGRRTHGLIRVQPMLARLASRGHSQGKWLKEDACSALYDGLGGLGYLTAHTCAAKAIEILQKSPFAVVGACGATHTGPIGYFARMLARKGYIGILFANCSPMAAPYGAKEPVLGTNPITIGLPFEPEPVIVDLATTATTYGECRVAISEGRALPQGVALDSLGNQTTDPRQALEGGCLLPFAAHKGYALALAVQILSSALTGASAVPEPGTDYALSVIGMNRDILVSAGRYDSITAELLSAVKAAAPVDPEKPVQIPGERSAANRQRARKKGIEISQQLYEELFRDQGV
jgi:L-2-hydroxycarboxylate dehydrogenase (NAD+)